jgi:5-methyltetrahydropteroyltriglutamate--homocysteine methyltransferase
MTRNQESPPFRAEHIGSLLRPEALVEARGRFARREVDRAELTAAEDRAIDEAVRLQERVGLKLATDGEFRRASYHSYFYGQIGDISFEARSGEAGTRGAQPVASLGSRIAWKGPIHTADFSFLRMRTKAVPKITIPGPCALHFRGGDAAVTAHAYRDVDEFWDDIVAAFQSELRSLAAAGCSYVQIDETAFAKFGDAAVQADLRARGDDPDALIDKYIDVTNRVLAGVPGISIGMHLCRGNRGGQWHAEGSYEAVADKLFNNLAIAFFFLEYDSPRAGDFAPLRFVPRNKTVVLGLVSSKVAALESMTEVAQRIQAAAQFVPLENLCLSPQCGFASTAHGNQLTEEQQWAKMSLIVKTTQEVWGEAGV